MYSMAHVWSNLSMFQIKIIFPEINSPGQNRNKSELTKISGP